MKILMLTWEYPPFVEGGLAAHVKGLSESLVSLGHTIHVVTPGQSSIEEEISGVKVHRVKLGSFPDSEFPLNVLQENFGLVAKCADIITKEKIHLIHAHDWLVNFAAQTLKQMTQVPVIATIHATEKGRNRGIHDSLQRYIHQNEWGLTYEAWHLICCSQFMKAELLESFDLPEDKLSIIPNGVSLPSSAPEGNFTKAKYALDHEKIVFTVGRLVYEKGFQVLIDAAPFILESVPEAKFVISGKGYYLEELKNKISFMGLEDKFLFTGFIADAEKEALYRMSSAVVFPSLYEPFGIVALEAMACSAPVIVSDLGGLAEVVDDNITGLKFTPNDPYSLADKVVTLLTNPDFGWTIGTIGAQKIQNFYTWHNIAKQTEDVYTKVYRNFLESPWGINKRVVVWSGFRGKEYQGNTENKEEKTEDNHEKQDLESKKVTVKAGS